MSPDGRDGDPPPTKGARARLLLDFCHLVPDAEAIGTAAELARLLRCDLFGIYVEDEAVQRLAGLPFARELRLPSQAWSPLEPMLIEAEFRQVAAGLQAMLRRHAARHDVRSEFQAVRGNPAGHVAGVSVAADVMLLKTPREASARALGNFAAAWRAAMEAPAAALLLPPRMTRRRGPVAVVLDADAATRARAAAALASEAGEDLVALVHDGGATGPSLQALGRATGLPEQRLSVRRLAEPTLEALVRALRGVGARLVILDRRFLRGTEPQAATKLSEALGVPLLFD